MTVRTGLQTRLTLAKLYAFADARRVDDLTGYVRAVVDGGADVVQVRLHGIGEAKRQAMFESVRGACADSEVVLVVDDDLDVAARTEADALLLDGRNVDKARLRLHRWALVGQHAGSRDDLADVGSREADFAVVGPVVRNGRTTALLDDAVEAEPPSDPESLRWFADGGITAATVQAVLDAGARRIGVGSALMSASDPAAVARQLKAAVVAAWQDDPAMEAVVAAAFQPSPRATLKGSDELRRDGLLPGDGAGAAGATE